MGSSRVHRSTRLQKIAFVADHLELLMASPTELANALKTAGLLAPTTSPIDIRANDMKFEAKRLIAERRKR